MKKPIVIVILGQTATGKSDLAVDVAKKVNGEIISADSRQVYKGLDIGTGKITRKEMLGVRHHLLDVADPKNKFNVVDFQKQAITALTDIVARGKTPIICGGAGFYIDAITKGLIFPEVPPNQHIRDKLSKKSAEKLFEYLKKLDKNRAENIDPNNKIRLIRAIEMVLHLGKVPKVTVATSPYKFIKVGLYLPNNELKEKVEARVKGMFKKGLEKEIQKLKEAGVREARLRELGFEYFNPTYESVVTGTLKYAKRQMTWFKRDKQIKWFKPSEEAKILALLSAVALRARLSKHFKNHR